MQQSKALNKIRIQRKRRTRASILGTAQKPRLSVFKSNKFTYLQLIDDTAQKTIASVSSRGLTKATKNIFEKLGNDIAQKAKEKKISQAILDRGAYKFHGAVKLITESLRKEGIKI